VYAEAHTVLRAVVRDFVFNCYFLEIPSDNRICTYQGASTVMLKILDCKRFRISMFEMEATLHSCIP
jgi:hypothetical protein